MAAENRKWTRRDFLKGVMGGALAASSLSFLQCDQRARLDSTTLGVMVDGRYCRPLSGKDHFVYFGDLHVHSNISPDVVNAEATPDALYQYALNVTRLDFAAMTDHDCPPGLFRETNELWKLACDVARQYYAPGKFVTFPAYEWTSGNGLYTLADHLSGKDRWAYQNDPTHFGHRNVFFPTDDVPDQLFAVTEPESDTPEKLWALLKPYKAITIPHHPLGGPVPPLKWEHQNPEMEPLVEVYSLHGSSEADLCAHQVYNAYLNGKHSVQYALSTGYQLGFIGSSDSHAAKPGTQTYDEDHMYHAVFAGYDTMPKKGGGLACVYAESCTREAIWEGLINKRTYCTTGSRIIMDMTVDEHFMGSALKTGRPATVRARVLGEAPLTKLEVVKNGQVVHTATAASAEATLSYTDEDAWEGDSYFYVRATQTDEEMAWSSPVWVSYR